MNQQHIPEGYTLSILVNRRGGQERRIPLNKQVTSIGRDPSNDIVINELALSSFHLQIIFDGQRFILEHPPRQVKKTLNGLFYKDQYIEGKQKFHTSFQPGESIVIQDENNDERAVMLTLLK